MPRRIFISIILSASLCGAAAAEDVTENHASEVMPVARSSNSAFDLLSPIIEARVAFENGRFDESFKNYSAVFLHDPDNIDVLFGLAKSALAIGKNEIAIKAYSRLSQHDLKAAQAVEQFSGLVLAEVAAGKSEAPESRLKQALELTPNDFRLWNALGQFYDTQSRWNESQQAYKQAESHGFSAAGLNNNLGISALAQGNYEIAEHYFEKARDLNPQQTQFENNYRFSLLMQGHYKRALEKLDDSQAGLILGDAGFIAMQREEYVLARLLLEKSIDISPRYNEQAVRNLEKLETRDNQIRHAERHTNAQ